MNQESKYMFGKIADEHQYTIVNTDSNVLYYQMTLDPVSKQETFVDPASPMGAPLAATGIQDFPAVTYPYYQVQTPDGGLLMVYYSGGDYAQIARVKFNFPSAP